MKNLVDSDSTQLIFTPEGKFKDLALKASNLVQSSPVKFVYFVAGLSDITTKLTEVIFTRDRSIVVNDVVAQIRETEHII